MQKIVVVPGLAVRGYATVAVSALADAGLDADLVDPPAWRTVPADLDAYGRVLGRRLHDDARPTAVLVGLSVGTQAAAVAAAVAGDQVRQLLLISPTVDPARRSTLRLLASWLQGEDHRDSPPLTGQVSDWRHAGVPRIYRGLRSAVRLPLEQVLPDVTAEITIVHAEADQLSAHAYAVQLAEQNEARLLFVPDAPHSWPTGDAARFVSLVSGLVA